MVGPSPPTWRVDPGTARAFAVHPEIQQLRLPVPWASMRFVNAYLIDGEAGGSVLVDCGGGGDPTAWEALLAAFAEAGRDVASVTDLVLTHLHTDHVGQAARVAEVSGCTVWAHPAGAHLLDARERPRETEALRRRLAAGQGVPDRLLDAFATVAEEVEGVDGWVPPARALVPGAQVPSALGPWEVVETPGHAPSQVCLHQPAHRIVIAADLLAPGFAAFVDVGYTPDPIAEYLASLDAVAGLDARLVLFGHGRPATALGPVADLFRAGLAAKLDAVAAALPGSGFEIAQRVPGLPEADEIFVWSAMDTFALLDHLVATGRAERALDAGGTLRYAAATPHLARP